MAPSNISKGFTLIELVIVLAIIGILASIAIISYSRSMSSAQLKEAATQLAADFTRIRSEAQQSSQNQTITWAGSGPVDRYTLNGQEKVLPNGATFECLLGCGSATSPSVTYLAPNGELLNVGTGPAGGTIFSINSPRSGTAPLEVRLVGLTGKVSVTGERNP